MQPDLPVPASGAPAGDPRRARRIALLLVAAACLALAAGGALLVRVQSTLRNDPGLAYRDAGTLEKVLARANAAELAGDRATAITAYRFVAAVAEGGETRNPRLAPYVAAARAGLKRLGVADTLPGPAR